jgi:hypothetical protein
MRLESIGSEITGIAMLHRRPDATIILTDPATRVTRLFLIEEAGPGAVALGFNVGDIVLPKKVNDILLYGGLYHRATFPAEEIIKRVRDVTLDEFTDLEGKPILKSIKAPALVVEQTGAPS